MSRSPRADTPTAPPPPPGGAGGMPLAHELGGDLPCVRCRYNLRGLSIRAVCPECGTPLRATLLAVVDPLANEFRPIRRRALVATGVTIWSFAALASCLAAWLVRSSESSITVAGFVGDGEALRLAVPILAGLSGLGAVSLIRPHEGIKRANIVKAAIGLALYAPLCVLLQMWIESSGSAGPFSWAQAPRGRQAVLGLSLCALLATMLTLLRPNARLLAARSLLLRSGQVDRQTMRTVAAVLVICIAGYVGGLIAAEKQGPPWDAVRSVGGLLILVGWSMFLMGLIGIAHDCWLMRAVIAQPPFAMTDLLSGQRREGQPRPSRVWTHDP